LGNGSWFQAWDFTIQAQFNHLLSTKANFNLAEAVRGAAMQSLI
jgi:hypothetical protein